MKTSPIKGTKDFLPQEMQVRDFLQNTILSAYKKSGFVRIETPMLESVENLDKSEGGDNLNLIFKILKRKQKLQNALENGEELADLALRYDLTLPLSRYYAANKEVLPHPFKVIQMGKAFRAERPQKGRMREFMQCDIDIIGDESVNAEIELINTTASALLLIGFKGFTVHVNDRRMLKSMLLGFGFESESLNSVCVSFDKLDKIGASGVVKELLEKGMNESAINNLGEFLNKEDFTLGNVKTLLLNEHKPLADEMEKLIDISSKLSSEEYKVSYSPRLVRGQDYYSGIVFEITCDGFAGAIGGGGRYDNMIGKFINERVPAVGFSIGFERIAGIILENKIQSVPQSERLALLYKSEDDFAQVLTKAKALQNSYEVCVLPAGKKISKQLNRLCEQGINNVCFFENYPQVKAIKGANNGE